MTLNDAVERAKRIWGGTRLVGVGIRPDGGANVELTQGGIASNVRGRNYQVHRLDVNGHPACHDDCVVAEKDACS